MHNITLQAQELLKRLSERKLFHKVKLNEDVSYINVLVHVPIKTCTCNKLYKVTDIEYDSDVLQSAIDLQWGRGTVFVQVTFKLFYYAYTSLYVNVYSYNNSAC